MKDSSQHRKLIDKKHLLITKEPQPDVLCLFEDILNNCSDLRIRVTGRSMAPFLKGGEILTIRKVPPSTLRRGDLIFFRNENDSPVLHRIIRKIKADDGVITLQTMGDSLRAPDAPVSQDEVLGKVRMIERNSSVKGIKQIDMESTVWMKVNLAITFIQLIKTEMIFPPLRFLKRKVLRSQS